MHAYNNNSKEEQKQQSVDIMKYLLNKGICMTATYDFLKNTPV